MKKQCVFFLLSLASYAINAQQVELEKNDKGQFSGNFQTNNQFYQRDDRIGANTTQYLRELSSTDAWLYLNYKIKGYIFTMRYDLYNNSPLFNPQQAYSNQGIGYWQISKDLEKLNLTAGYFYDQFGSGAVFRAYEDRNIGIDFAIFGARAIYSPTENTRIKAFTGKQKYRFGTYEPIIKGVNLEQRLVVNENLSFEPGASLINRTLDANTMSSIASSINSYPLADRFYPKYNVFAFNFYNTLNYKNFSWLVEYNQKTPEAILDYQNILRLKAGHIFFTSLAYSTGGFGIVGQFRRMETFPLRVNPLEIQPIPNNGPINYLPALTRQNTYRLLARYNSVPQELGENCFQIELTYKMNKSTQLNVNGSIVNTLNGLSIADGYQWNNNTRLFREIYVDGNHKFSKKFKATLGIQFIGYNQQVLEGKAAAPFVKAITPFGEMTYKLNTKRSLRFEWQYMSNEGDLGSFANALLEYNVAPHWSFAAGDLVNVQHGYLNKPIAGQAFEIIHYYNFFAAYTYKNVRVTGGYLKQPQGVNCTGGVCRIEPAFSGGRLTLTTNF